MHLNVLCIDDDDDAVNDDDGDHKRSFNINVVQCITATFFCNNLLFFYKFYFTLACVLMKKLQFIFLVYILVL